jgi:hypothetical protein
MAAWPGMTKVNETPTVKTNTPATERNKQEKRLINHASLLMYMRLKA